MANSVCNQTSKALTSETNENKDVKALWNDRHWLLTPAPSLPCGLCFQLTPDVQTACLSADAYIPHHQMTQADAHPCFQESSLQVGEKSGESCEWDYRGNCMFELSTSIITGLRNITFPCHTDSMRSGIGWSLNQFWSVWYGCCSISAKVY